MKYTRRFLIVIVVVLLMVMFVEPVECKEIPKLPKEEVVVIEEAAREYGLRGDAKMLLYVIRKVENGREGREFGVLHPRAINTDFRNQCQWAAGTIKKRYDGDLLAFANRWCPIGAKNDPTGLNVNWYVNAKYYMDK